MAGCGKDSSDDSTTQLGAVTGLTITAGDSQNTLTWDALEEAVSYNIYWEETSTARTSGRVADCNGDRLEGITGNSHTHTGLANGVEYNYGVTGVDADGNEGECGNGDGGASGTPVASSGGGSGSKPKPAPTVNGCTDPTATNYNPNATVDDGSCTYAPDPLISSLVFIDANLTTCVNNAAAANGWTTVSQMINLDCSTLGIVSIAGIEQLTALTRLDLSTNQIVDVTPLSGLTALTSLDLDTNQIVDVTPLAGLTALTLLFLSNNQIVDVTPLAGMTALTRLYLDWNQIVDVTSLAGLTALSALGLSNNQIVDVTPLAGLTSLTTLYIWNNQIVDVTPLAGLTALTWLDLSNNQIVDVTPLAGLTALSALGLSNNQIGGQGVGNVHLLSPAAGASIYLSNNLGQSCAELGTLLTNYPGGIDLDGDWTGGGVGDVATNGVTCTNP